jgi:proton-dependent oligopeptide transporter, POT family
MQNKRINPRYGLGVASYSEMTDRLSYYGLQSLLVLYLMHSFHATADWSYSVYGAYAALNFASCIVGGMVADRFIAPLQSVMTGACLMLLGNVFLFFATTLPHIYFGITFLILGVGLMKPPTACLVKVAYDNAHAGKEKAFVYFYMLGNVGSIIGPLVYGLGISSGHYREGFLYSVVFLAVNVVSLVCFYRKYRVGGVPTVHGLVRLLPVLVLVGLLMYGIISRFIDIAWLLIPALLVCVFLLYLTVRRAEPHDKWALSLLYVPILTSTAFFTLFLQMYSSLLVFIKTDLNTVVYGFHIPATWFTSLEPFFLLIVSPVLAQLWQVLQQKGVVRSGQNQKLFVGMLSTALTFLCFALATHMHDTASMWLIVLGNIFLAIGDMSVIAISIAWIAERSPENVRGMLMGVFYFALSFSGFLSGKLAELSQYHGDTSIAGYTHFFINIAMMALVLGVVLCGSRWVLSRWEK